LATGGIWLPDGGHIEPEHAHLLARRCARSPALSAASASDRTFDLQSCLFGDRGQAVLRPQMVGVIGTRGAGSLVIQYLARLGVGHLGVVDPERIERPPTCRAPLAADDMTPGPSLTRRVKVNARAQDRRVDFHRQGEDRQSWWPIQANPGIGFNARTFLGRGVEYGSIRLRRILLHGVESLPLDGPHQGGAMPLQVPETCWAPRHRDTAAAEPGR
jgi:hypothetical protein